MALNVNGGPLSFEAGLELTNFQSAIARIEAQLQGLTKTAEREAKAIDNLMQKTATAISGYVTLSAGTDLIRQIIQVRGEMEQLEVAFTTMLQSKEKADKLMQEIVEFAATTPFELKEVAGATKQLLAFGIPAEKIKETLRSLGDVSAGIGQPLGEIAYLFGTIKTQGTAFTQDVRQFAQRGIPIYEELSKILKVSVEEVGNFISAGKVGFPEIEKVFKNLTAAGAQFGGLMEAQSKTLLGQISNLRDGWDQMLNAIGKSNQGIFNDVVAGLSFLVENYETVIDILKVLVITYGAYKAAIVATNVVQGIATSLAKGWTAAQLLQYHATLMCERAMKLLNATILKNPAAYVVAGVTAIVASFILLRKEVDRVKSAQVLMAEAQEKFTAKLSETEGKIRPYIEQLKNANLTEEQRLTIYNRLKEIDPKIVEGLSAKTLSYKTLTQRVNDYISALRQQYAVEASKEAIQKSVEAENKLFGERVNKVLEMNAKLADLEKSRQSFLKSGRKDADQRVKSLEKSMEIQRKLFQQEIAELKEREDLQKEVTKSLTESSLKKDEDDHKAHVRNLGDIDAEIKALKEKQSTLSETHPQHVDYQKQINKLEAERKKIVGDSQADIRAAETLENKTLALLEKRKAILEKISDKQLEAEKSGMTKQEAQIATINEGYSDLLDQIQKLNAELERNPKSAVPVIGAVELEKLAQAQRKEISNEYMKEEAERFKKDLSDKLQLFEKYEDAKKEIGVKYADEIYQTQLEGFTSLEKYLTSKKDSLQFNLNKKEEYAAVIDALKDLDKKRAMQKLNLEYEHLRDLLEISATYNQQKAAINKKYDDLQTTLESKRNIEDYEERKKLLEKERQERLETLEDESVLRSDIYERLNKSLLRMTRQDLRKELEELETYLNEHSDLTPDLISRIRGRTDQIKSVLTDTNEIVYDYMKLSEELSEISNIFGLLANSVGDLNAGLADTLDTLSSLSAAGSNFANAIASFASGPEGIISGISSLVSGIGGLFSIGSKARESRRKAQAELEEYQARLMAGELELNQLYWDRERSQIRVNELTLLGLAKQRDLLKEQQEAVKKQYDSVLAQLQQQSYIVDKTTEKYGGILGVGRKTRVVNISATIGNQSFEDLEKLYTSGRLEGKAKELFELLQKIKQEGADINELLLQNQKEAQEIFTGTTTDSLVDAIADGFKGGLRTISDFTGTFEEKMRDALINAFKFKYLEGPLDDFYKQFAEAAESNGELTSAEIAQLNSLFNSIIETSQQQFDQLQQISGLNLTSNAAGGGGNSLAGSIQGMSQQTAELIAGQFGGLRLTANEHLKIGTQQLSTLTMIQANTGLMADRALKLLEKFDRYETGAKRLKVEIS